MRLICPNCDAQYEVDDAAIPTAGRDVQCSSCGHGWFQAHPEVEAERAAESALHDAPQDAAPVTPLDAAPDTPPDAPPDETAAVMETAAIADAAPEAEQDAPPDAAPDADAQSRQIDEAVLNVLREEADREMIARRLEAEAPIETQTDLGIDDAAAVVSPQMASSARHIARLKGEDPDAEPEIKREMTRREMLPDIEEINSSLRPGDVAVGDDGETFEIVQRPRPRSGFRSGFVLMVVLAIAVVAVYVMAPRIAEQIPGAKPALDSYVVAVDSARGWLDRTTRAVIDGLQGLAGGDDTP